MACIHTHLISGASAVSLVSRFEDRTILLSSSLRSFSGPAQLRCLSVPECWAGLGNEATLVSRDNLSSCTSSTPCFLFCPGLTQPACVFCAVLFQRRDALSRSILRFSFRLLRCLRGPSRVTLRTRLCHIDDPRSFTS